MTVQKESSWAGRDGGEYSPDRHISTGTNGSSELVLTGVYRPAVSPTRPVLASTAELHQRISQLEQALQDCYSSITGTKALHPLIASGSYNYEPLVDNSSKPLEVPSSSRKSSASTSSTHKPVKKEETSDEEAGLGEVSSNMGMLTLGDAGTSRWHGGAGSAYLLVSSRTDSS